MALTRRIDANVGFFTDTSIAAVLVTLHWASKLAGVRRAGGLSTTACEQALAWLYREFNCRVLARRRLLLFGIPRGPAPMARLYSTVRILRVAQRPPPHPPLVSSRRCNSASRRRGPPRARLARSAAAQLTGDTSSHKSGVPTPPTGRVLVVTQPAFNEREKCWLAALTAGAQQGARVSHPCDVAPRSWRPCVFVSALPLCRQRRAPPRTRRKPPARWRTCVPLT